MKVAAERQRSDSFDVNTWFLQTNGDAITVFKMAMKTHSLLKAAANHCVGLGTASTVTPVTEPDAFSSARAPVRILNQDGVFLLCCSYSRTKFNCV